MSLIFRSNSILSSPPKNGKPGTEMPVFSKSPMVHANLHDPDIESGDKFRLEGISVFVQKMPIGLMGYLG